MDFIEEQLLELAYLMLRKAKIEKKLRQTFKCLLRKCFSCCGMKNIEIELQKINEAIEQVNNKNKKKIVRSSSI